MMELKRIHADKEHLQFKHPFTSLAAGPSGSGKTCLIRDILECHKEVINGLNKDHINVIWAYGKWQKLYQQKLKNVNFKYLEGVPDEEDVEGYDVIIIDDLMQEINSNKYILDLFTKGSHHNEQSVIILKQNLYHKGPIVRDLNLNSHYLIIFKSPRDTQQIMTLGRQVYYNDVNFFKSAYLQATELPHGYLLVDLKQDTPVDLRLKSRIIPAPETNFALEPFGFIPK